MNNKRLLPPTYFYLAIGLMALLHFLLPGPTVIPRPWHLSGILLFILGVALNIVADSTFKKHNTTVKPFVESTALVTGGVFQISRNPMYLGFVLMLAGIALLLRSLTPFAVIIPFTVLLDRKFIAVEEAMLAEKFGRSWREYRQKVRRWL